MQKKSEPQNSQEYDTSEAVNFIITTEQDLENLINEQVDALDPLEKWMYKNIDLLIRRVKKLEQIKSGTVDYWTYYDIILVQIRALFIESPRLKSNYTVQNYLIKIGENKLAEEINEYFDTELSPGITLREAIKVSVDKFIAHYDEIDDRDLMIENLCRIKLTGYEKHLTKLLKDMLLIMIRGNLKAWERIYQAQEISDDDVDS
jgi:hypothetical protein